MESDGPGLCSLSPAARPKGWRSPVEIEFSRVFSLSANSFMYLEIRVQFACSFSQNKEHTLGTKQRAAGSGQRAHPRTHTAVH